MHHSVSDETSFRVFFEKFQSQIKELTEKNISLLENDHVGDGEEKVQGIDYRNYLSWIENWIHSDKGGASKEYWANYLSGYRKAELPDDNTYLMPKTFATEETVIECSQDTYSLLRSMATEQGVSFYALLVSCVLMFVHRFSRSEDIVIGTAVSIRELTPFQDTIGPLINTVPIRVTVSPESSIFSIIHSTHQLLLSIFDNCLLPSDLIKSSASLENDFFDVGFTLLGEDDGEIDRHNSELEMSDFDAISTKIWIVVRENREQLNISMFSQEGFYCRSTLSSFSSYIYSVIRELC